MATKREAAPEVKTVSPGIRKGSQVRQKVTPIEGEVTSKQFDEDTNEFRFEVAYTGDDGESHSRWFNESEIEVV